MKNLRFAMIASMGLEQNHDLSGHERADGRALFQSGSVTTTRPRRTGCSESS